MEPKIIKLNKKDDIAIVVKKIKDLKEREVIFELEKGSALLDSSNNLRLIKKTGEVLGKRVRVVTDDPTGQILARKADMLYEEAVEVAKNALRPKVRRSNVSFRGFSDIRGPKRILPLATARNLNLRVSSTVASMVPKLPAIPKLNLGKLPRNISRKLLWVLAALVLAGVASAVLLPKASINVYARSEPITRDFEIQVDSTVKEVDSPGFRIPGQLVSKEVSHTKTYPTTGVKLSGTKSTGSVVIYNFTKNTIRLRAATTTLVANGKNYYFVSDATGIRPTSRTGSGDDQEVDPKSLTAPVALVAGDAGEGYNLPVNTRFEVKNEALGNAEVYAISSAAITGGAATSVKIMSQEDFDKAVVAMTDELVGKVEQGLSEESSEDTRLLPTGVSVEVLAKTANIDVGTEAEEFDITVIGRVKGLAFKENDVKTVVIDKINNVLSSDKYLLENAEQEVIAKFKSLDLEKGNGVLTVHFETNVAYRIDDSNFDKILAGKTATEIKEILLTKPEIDRVDVKFSPFFVNRAPRFNGNIEVNILLSEAVEVGLMVNLDCWNCGKM